MIPDLRRRCFFPYALTPHHLLARGKWLQAFHFLLEFFARSELRVALCVRVLCTKSYLVRKTGVGRVHPVWGGSFRVPGRGVARDESVGAGVGVTYYFAGMGSIICIILPSTSIFTGTLKPFTSEISMASRLSPFLFHSSSARVLPASLHWFA